MILRAEKRRQRVGKPLLEHAGWAPRDQDQSGEHAGDGVMTSASIRPHSGASGLFMSLLSHFLRPAGIAVDLRFVVVVTALLFVLVFGGARGSASLLPCCSFRFLLYSRQKDSPRRDTRTKRGRKREGRSQVDTLDLLSLHPTAPGENEAPFLREIGR